MSLTVYMTLAGLSGNLNSLSSAGTPLKRGLGLVLCFPLRTPARTGLILGLPRAEIIPCIWRFLWARVRHLHGTRDCGPPSTGS